LVNNAFATLYVNGQAVNTQTIRSLAGTGNLRFTGFSQVVTSSTPLKLEVKVSFTESFATNDTVSVALAGVDAVDTVSSQLVNPGSYPTAATLTFKNAQ
jgi:pyruvate/oxaloacetate carboxyltransferase